jgi:hypothetical protein
MGRPIRRNSKRAMSSPQALASLLPEGLRSLEGLDAPSDYQEQKRRVVAWLDQIAPGRGHEMAAPVLRAAALSAADYYRRALISGTHNG